MEKKLIAFKTDKSGITIRIPKGLISYVAKHNPETPLRVLDSSVLMNKVAFELEHNLGDNETGLTGFQKLMDAAIMSVAENGEECVEFKDRD